MNTVKIEKKNVLMVAHRGVSGIEKENTCSAFVAAGNRSYYGIETDVHKTADGKFVICHDSDLFRVSGERINVEEVSLAVSESVVLFDRDGTKSRNDLRPCALEDYISICKKYEKHCVLELKSDFSEEETANMIELIRSFDYLENVTFISFWYPNLEKVRAICPSQSVQYLFSEVTDEIIERVARDKMDVDVGHNSLTEQNIKAFHEKGIKVNCWTVDNKERAEQLVSFGVDYITSNILE